MPVHTPHPTDPFRSARLMYRAVSPSDVTLLQTMNEDRLGRANSSAANIKLPTTKDAEGFQKALSEDYLLGAVICIAPPSQSQSSQNHFTKYQVGEEPKGETEAERLKRIYGTPIGKILLKPLPRDLTHHRFTEIGIQILGAYQGQAYGSEALNWVLDYAFRRAGLHRVAIRAAGWNVGAVRLYERLGFTVEGRDREACWHEGRWWDVVNMGMLEGEWWELQREFDEKEKKKER